MAKKKPKASLRICKECIYAITSNGTFCRLRLQDEKVLKESAKVVEVDCQYFKSVAKSNILKI